MMSVSGEFTIVPEEGMGQSQFQLLVAAGNPVSSNVTANVQIQLDANLKPEKLTFETNGIGPVGDLIDAAVWEINWKLKNVKTQAQTEYGTSKNMLYVTGANVNNQFETVLHIGCTGAKGRRPADQGDHDPGASVMNQDVVNGIWSHFAQRQVNRVDGQPLTFWGVPAIARNVKTTATLLKEQHGACGAWADFFVKVLHAQGIIGARVSNIHVNQPIVHGALGLPQGAPAGPYLLGTIARIKASLPGQNNGTPKNDFVGVAKAMNGAQLPPGIPETPGIHAIVKIEGFGALLSAGTIYDPSYGERFDAASMPDAERAWEDASLDRWHYRYYLQGGQTQDSVNTVNHQQGRPDNERETLFD
jgi:hypothetical protein